MFSYDELFEAGYDKGFLAGFNEALEAADEEVDIELFHPHHRHHHHHHPHHHHHHHHHHKKPVDAESANTDAKKTESATSAPKDVSQNLGTTDAPSSGTPPTSPVQKRSETTASWKRGLAQSLGLGDDDFFM